MNNRRVSLLAFLSVILLVTGCTSNRHPVAVIIADRTQGYPPLDIVFSGAASQGIDSPLVSYDWDFGDGGAATSVDASHTFEDKGTFSVSLTVTDANGTIGSTIKTIHVLNQVPHADFRITPFGAPRDYPVQFDASQSEDPDGEIVSYLWDFGDGTHDEGLHVEHIFPQQQTEYVVTLTVIDDSGASNHSIRKVVVLGCDTCG